MPSQPDHRITIRFKPDEYALIMAKAGDRPIAKFLRDMILADAAARRNSSMRRPVQDKRALAQVLALLGGSDLVAQFKEASTEIDDGVRPSGEDTDRLLKRIADTLAQIKHLLMQSLGVQER